MIKLNYDEITSYDVTSYYVITDYYQIIVDSPGDSSRYLLNTTNYRSTHEMKSFVYSHFVYSHCFVPRLAMVE